MASSHAAHNNTKKQSNSYFICLEYLHLCVNGGNSIVNRKIRHPYRHQTYFTTAPTSIRLEKPLVKQRRQKSPLKLNGVQECLPRASVFNWQNIVTCSLFQKDHNDKSINSFSSNPMLLHKDFLRKKLNALYIVLEPMFKKNNFFKILVYFSGLT